jgi:hypothetical protein
MQMHLKRVVWIVLVALIAWGALIQVEASHFDSLHNSEPGTCAKTGNPILGLELATSGTCFQKIIDRGNRAANIQVVYANTCMDFLFIFLYWLQFTSFARYYSNRWSKLVVILISATAISDLLENWRILSCLQELERSSSVQSLTPAIFGYPKWALFGASLLLVGLLVKAPGEERHRTLGWIFALAGVLFVAGVPTQSLKPALGVTVLGTAMALIVYFPLCMDETLAIVEYSYLIRFQILFSALLAVLLPVFYWVVPSVFVGLFDAVHRVSFTLVVWAAFQLAWIVMITSRLVLVYGADRFPGVNTLRIRDANSRTVVLFGLLAIPFIVVLCLGTLDLSTPQKAEGVVAGLAAAILCLLVIAKLHFLIEDDSGHTANRIFPSFGFLRHTHEKRRLALWRFLDRLVQTLPPKLQDGLIRDGQLRSGHQLATISLSILLLLYVTIGVVYIPKWVSPERQPAAILYVLLLSAVLLWLFSGAAFFLDVLRVPVLTSFLILSLLTGLIRTDHHFHISPHTSVQSLPPEIVIESWARHYRDSKPTRENPRYAIVIATAGGGIRAAAWTAEVLLRLREQCGPEFSSSLLLVSSVSGGSVGAMNVLSAYDSSTRDFLKSSTSPDEIRASARRSTLSAAGWGLVYPDYLRTMPFIGSLLPETVDRGWALENAWISGWKTPPNMSDWRAEVARGNMPAIIFNATAAENGKRVIIASIDTNSNSTGAMPFYRDFSGYDIPVSTAARLSATFPYISPEARASTGSDLVRVHIGDGGYYDNSGILGALEWLREAKPALDKGQYKVLFLTIEAAESPPKTTQSWSWQKQIIGPIKTLLSVRTSSQQDRDSQELQLEQEVFGRAWTEKPIRFVYSVPANSVIDDETLLAKSLQPDESSPLSWHLNKVQIERITKAWNTPENQEASHSVCSVLSAQ